MSVIASWTALFALAVVAVIGIDLSLRSPRRREDSGSRPAMQPGDVDPANLRRRRPLTQRLTGAVLLLAVVILYILIRPFIGL